MRGITAAPENVLDVLEYGQTIIELDGAPFQNECMALFPHPFIGMWRPSQESWAIGQKLVKDYNERRRPKQKPLFFAENVWEKRRALLTGIVAIVWVEKINNAEVKIDKMIKICISSRPIMMPPQRAIQKRVWILSAEKSDTLRRYGATQ